MDSTGATSRRFASLHVGGGEVSDEHAQRLSFAVTLRVGLRTAPGERFALTAQDFQRVDGF